MHMIPVTPIIAIDEKEIAFDFIRGSGPGGQNVNKVATAVQLRFDVRKSPNLPAEVRARLMRLAGRRITHEGVLVIEARRFRTQERNRQDALDRLIAWIQKASEKPRPRLRTRPSKVARARLLAAKRRRSRIKQMRRTVSASED